MINLITIVLMSVMLSKTACLNEKADDSYVSIVVIVESPDKKYVDDLKKIIEGEQNKALKFTINSIILAEGEEYPCFVNICSNLTEGLSLILDLSWRGWNHAENTALRLGVPYIRVDITIQQLVRAADDYLQNRNATDAVLVFQNDNDLEQALLYLVGNSIIRILVLDGLNETVINNLRAMRPMPTTYVIYGKSSTVAQLAQLAFENDLMNKISKMVLVYEDFIGNLYTGPINGTVSYLYPDEKEMCCYLLSTNPTTNKKSCTCEKEIRKLFAVKMFRMIHEIFKDIKVKESKIISIQYDCKNEPQEVKEPLKTANQTFTRYLTSEIKKHDPFVVLRDNILLLSMNVNITSQRVDEKYPEVMGVWSTEKTFALDESQKDKKIRSHYNIGVAYTTPFTFKKKFDNDTEILDGFCIQLVYEMAKKMDFDFDFVFPENNSFGVRNDDGTWDGLIGDLMNGTTDIVVAALTMTSEREEAIDFVAPHFDQTGILIVMKKAEKEVSLFKFMSVLESEVWWCILGAIIVTAIVLWLLDKYSPFSGQNKKRYPYETRKFTLVECFWFALTSITPQGGGEPPKAISGRILVAAYWLFVVLMLATFTANLAAFLTVERMQTPVKSLEDLAKQSKINYTVVKDSSVEQYFANMAAAENDLYRVWKDMTLNTSTDQAKYRVWDYPIKEQYNRIYEVIKKTGFMASTEEGFAEVKNDKKGEFAFIHDAAEIRYEVYRSCDLLEVGEVFAEQPYAIAVQSGSHLQEEISKVLLDLQKDRYFEQLYNQFWNATARRECPNYEDTEGITLQSLGGVFIATLVGLTIGMLTLIGEVILSKKKQKEKDKIQPFVQVRNKQPSANILEGIRTRTIHPRPRLAYNF